MKTKKALVLIVALILVAGIAYALSEYPLLTGINGNGFRIQPGTGPLTVNPPSSIGRSTICMKNTGSSDVFFPANTSTEWDSFLSHLPAGVSYTNGGCSAACTILIGAGGPGGGGDDFAGGPVVYRLNFGYVVNINNANGSTACGATVNIDNPPFGIIQNGPYTPAFTGPNFSVAAGGSYNDPPNQQITTSSSGPWPVGITISNISCPGSTKVVSKTCTRADSSNGNIAEVVDCAQFANGTDASCNFTLQGCSTVWNGSQPAQSCTVTGCASKMEIECR